MNTLEQKILALEQVPAWRASMRAMGRKVVATNGCFDILHAGHVHYLHEASQRGDALIVGLNSDASVRSLKPNRPINPEQDRALVLAALGSVDAVVIFSETRATGLLSMIQPDVYVKGGDYAEDQLPLEERQTVAKYGGRIEILPLVPGRSTTAILQKLQA